MRGDDVDALTGVAPEVIQLLPRGFDVLEVRGDQGAELVPSEGVPGIVGLGIHLFRRLEGAFVHATEKRLALEAGEIRAWELADLGDGRRDIQRRDRSGDDASFGCFARQLEDEWDLKGSVVDEKAVLGFAVFPKRFAVVAQDHDGGAIVELESAQASDHATDLRVVESDRAIIRPVWITPAIRFG